MGFTANTLIYGFLALSQAPWALAGPNCPLLGPEFPPPKKLAENPIWQAALASLNATFDYIDTTNVTGIDRLSYSIQIFSTNPGDPILWERHRTARNLPVDTLGVKTVDGNSVYRLGSVSKVITMLALLAEVGDIYMPQPITKLIPELARFSGYSTSSSFDPVKQTSWDDVTLGSLASQMSGLERDYGVLGEITQTPDMPATWLKNFPVLPTGAKPPCGSWPLCTRKEFFDGLETLYPAFPPWQTPGYSNIGYQLLAYALETLTKKNFTDILNDRVIKPLNLRRTYYAFAPPSVGIIPSTLSDSYWYAQLGDASPGGNMYSSPNDLSTIGRAILSSKILKPSLSRRWLNPVTFSADFAASIGAPWGIRRIQLSKYIQPHRSLSVFTKAGSFRRYTAFLTLLKDFNLGFTIMTAGKPGLNNFLGADLIGAALIPAYDAVARYEANLIYSGIYIGTDPGTGGPTTKSWITISTDPNKPGLGIGPWINNGTDMVNFAYVLQTGQEDLKPRYAEARLYYSQLESKTTTGGKKQAWKAVFEDSGGASYSQSMFSTSCAAWVGVTGVTYGSLPLDEFLFNFNTDGTVSSITNLALRQTYYKILY